MSKYNTIVKKERRSINKQEALLRRGRRGAYRGLQGVLEDLFGNLASTTKGQRSRLTRGNTRDLALIARLGQRQRAFDDRATHSYVRAVDRMGAGPGNMSTGELGAIGKPLTVAAGAADAAAKAGTDYGKSTAKVGEGVMNILESNAKGIKASAKQVAAMALSDQGVEDATLIAQQRHELAMAELQHQMELDRMKKQAALERKQAIFEQKLAEGHAGPVGMQLTAASNMLVTAASTIQNLKATCEETGACDPTTLAAQAVANLGLTSPQDIQAVHRLANLLTQDTQKGVGAAEVAGDVAEILRSIPAWKEAGKGKKDHLLESIYKQYRANEMDAGRNPGPDVTAEGKTWEKVMSQDQKEADAQGLAWDSEDSMVKFMEGSLNAAIKAAAPDMTAADRTKVVESIVAGSKPEDIDPEISDKLRSKLTGVINSWPDVVKAGWQFSVF